MLFVLHSEKKERTKISLLLGTSLLVKLASALHMFEHDSLPLPGQEDLLRTDMQADGKAN